MTYALWFMCCMVVLAALRFGIRPEELMTVSVIALFLSVLTVLGQFIWRKIVD